MPLGYEGLTRRLYRGAEGIEDGLDAFADVGEAAGIGHGDDSSLILGESVSGAKQAFAAHDGAQTVDGFIESIVHENIVVLLVILNFASGRLQTALDNFFAIFAALAQALLQRSCDREAG